MEKDNMMDATKLYAIFVEMMEILSLLFESTRRENILILFQRSVMTMMKMKMKKQRKKIKKRAHTKMKK